MFRIVAAILAVAAATAAWAQSADDPGIALAEQRGRLLYAYSQAGWEATQDMRSKVATPEQQVGGYLIDGPADSPTVIYYDRDAADPHAIYVAQLHSGSPVSGRLLGAGDDRSLSPARKALIAARSAAVTAWQQSVKLMCVPSMAPTAIVLPPSGPDAPTLVYLLTPNTKEGAFPMGGHYRYEVDAAGKVTGSRAFNNSCLSVPLGSQDGRRLASLTVPSPLDSIPNEIHVMLNYAGRIPINVISTVGGFSAYRIEGGKIRRLPNEALPAPQLR